MWKKRVSDRRGVTLVEMMTVVAILGLLAIILGFSFQGWLEKYKVEDETKRFYADVMDARARAMLKKRVTFVDLASNLYRTFEDTNTPPDGNGTFENALDTRVVNTTTTYDIVPLLGGGATRVQFDKEGLAAPTGTVRFASTGMSPDYDCVTIRTTRIRMGRWNVATTICEEK